MKEIRGGRKNQAPEPYAPIRSLSMAIWVNEMMAARTRESRLMDAMRGTGMSLASISSNVFLADYTEGEAGPWRREGYQPSVPQRGVDVTALRAGVELDGGGSGVLVPYEFPKVEFS